jgi:hypothetical protein
MLGNSSVPTSLKLDRGAAPRTILRELRLPSFLLLLVTAGVFAANIPSSAASSAISTSSVTTAASMPASISSPVPAALDQTAALPEAVHATLSDSAAEAAPVSFAALRQWGGQRPAGLSPKALAAALDAVSCARGRGVSGNSDVLTVIDYSLPSTQPRLWVLDLARRKVLFHELVAHGAGSGDVYATRFSNVNDSRSTSLGLFLTADTYEGGNGYSLKLKGLDAGVNDLAEARHIVMHGAWYVSPEHAQQFGMLGRSWGCPALPLADAKSVIDKVKGGSFVFAYAGGTAGNATGNGYRRASTASCTAPDSGGSTVRASLKTAR